MVLKPQEVPEDVFWVLETYKLTWFSNRQGNILHITFGFRDLQTYMVLKRLRWYSLMMPSFRSLQTYMVLKQGYALESLSQVLDPYKLTWFSNGDNGTINTK